VTARPLTEAERRRVRLPGRPPLQVEWTTWDALPQLPSAHGGLGAVTAATLHRHAIGVRGPRPSEVVADVDHATLAARVHANLASYWRPWLERARHDLLRCVTTLHPRLIEWGVVGVPRQYVSIVEGESVSKSEAVRRVRPVFDACWHRILDEALRLRSGTAGSLYRSPFARRHDMLGFLEHAIESTRAAYRAKRAGAD
jgi:hypothetical protein